MLRATRIVSLELTETAIVALATGVRTGVCRNAILNSPSYYLKVTPSVGSNSATLEALRLLSAAKRPEDV